MEFTTAIVIAILVIIVFYYLTEKRHRNLPPGPYGLPLVGYIPFITSKPHLKLQQLAERYGPVFRLRMGFQDVIVLSDFPSIKAAFSQDAFMGRPPAPSIVLFNKETVETGAFASLPWKEQRRFSLHVFRDLGFGKSRIEGLLKEEIQDLLYHFEQFEGKPFLLSPILAPSMSNNIASLVYGNRLKYDDPVRKMLDHCIANFASAIKQVAWELFFPSLSNFVNFFGYSGASKTFKTQQQLKQYTVSQIEEHEKTLDENNVRDYIDGYLLEIRKRKDETFCKPVLADLVNVFFNAGSETVRHTIDWLMLTMASFADVQEKVHSEIEDVIGRDRSPFWNDHARMPYTEATIMEMMRWRSIIPLNVLRYTLWDTELNGYFIPKHHFVISNLWHIHHNPEYWGEDAEEFRPDRFLTEDGKAIKKSEYFIPFSMGKRQCPGESFAKTEVFLYFVSIMQKFKVSLPQGIVPNFEGDLGISFAPKPHALCLTKRP